VAFQANAVELMRLSFRTKDPQPAVSERETWIILLSRKTKKEKETWRKDYL